MSIVGMRKNMHSWFRYVVILIAVVFAAGIVFMSLNSSRGVEHEESTRGGIVASVNGEKLDRVTFEARYAENLMRMAQQMGQAGRDAADIEESMGPMQSAMMRYQMLEQMTRDIAIVQAAKDRGIKVSRGEVKKEIEKAIEAEIDRLKEQVLADYQGKDREREFEKQLKEQADITPGTLRTRMRKSIDPDMVREELTVKKLMDSVGSKADTSEKAFRGSYDEIHLRQISVFAQNRSEAQAEERAKEILKKLRDGGDFAKLAKEYSEDGYKDSGGDWGSPIPVKYLFGEIGTVVSKLKAGEISDPVKSDQGYTIVKVESRKSNLPKDFEDEKKQKEYRDTFVAEARQAAVRDLTSEVVGKAKIEIVDPEMKALSILQKSGGMPEKKTYLDAIQEFKNALASQGGDSRAQARVYTHLAYLYGALRQEGLFDTTKEERVQFKAEQKKAVESALQSTETNELRMMLADLRIEDKQYDEAAEDLSIVFDNAYDSPETHEAILARYQSMAKAGYSDAAALIAKEKEWLAQYKKDNPSP